MEIKELLEPVELDYKDRIGNLDVEASGVVKSKKNFPIYDINGEKMIFKPLSKTKPLTTDMFAFAEVYWSYVIHNYFDSSAPLYKLSYCHGIMEKYYEKGTLVEKIGDKRFTNILEYFKSNPEDSFDISEYVNYCMMDYDYTKILNSDFIQANGKLGEDLSFQILLSILRMDQNFHYENVNMLENNGVYSLVVPLDFEFSTPFLYPENIDARTYYLDKYFRNLVFPPKINCEISKSLVGKFDFSPFSILFRNIYIIVKNYPNVVDRFLECLYLFYKDIDKIDLTDDYGFIGKCCTDYWNVGHAKYKENDVNKAHELASKMMLMEIDKSNIFKMIKRDVKLIAERIKSIILGIRLFINNGYELDDMSIENLMLLLGIDNEKEEVYNKLLKYE